MCPGHRRIIAKRWWLTKTAENLSSFFETLVCLSSLSASLYASLFFSQFALLLLWSVSLSASLPCDSFSDHHAPNNPPRFICLRTNSRFHQKVCFPIDFLVKRSLFCSSWLLGLCWVHSNALASSQLNSFLIFRSHNQTALVWNCSKHMPTEHANAPMHFRERLRCDPNKSSDSGADCLEN